MRLETIDWVVIALFVAVSIAVPLLVARRSGTSTSEFFVSGRDLPWWLAGTSMVATTFAADTPLAVTEIVRTGGVAGNWLWWSMLGSGMLTVFLFARLWRRTGVMTDVELSEVRYGGKRAAALRGFRAAYLAVPINAVIIGWVTTAMSSVLEVALGLDSAHRIGVVAALLGVTSLYSMVGGLRGVVLTDAIQFVIAMTGCVALAVFVVGSPQIGGLEQLVTRVRAVKPDALQMLPVTDAALGAFLVYVGVQWWASWYPGAEPGGGGYVAQRMMACKNERHAVLATLWFNVAHYALRPWPWILVALCSLVLLPDATNHKATYTQLIVDFMPSGWRGLILVAFFAAFMSTISTQLNWGSGYLVHDLYRRFLRKDADERHYVRMSRGVTLLTALLGAGVALLMESVKGGWELLLAIGAGTGPVYILRWYWWRISAWSEIAAMVASLVLALGVQGLKAAGVAMPPAPYDLLVVAVPATVVWLVVTFLTRPEHEDVLLAFVRKARPAGPGWAALARKLPDVERDTGLGRDLLDAAAGAAFVFGVLFGLGHALLGQPLAGAGYAAVALVGAGVLVWDARTRGFATLRG